jgi:hypothetical protein
VLVVISNTHHLFESDAAFAAVMKEPLTAVCLEGTGSQARKAIRAIVKGYSQKVSRTILAKLVTVRDETRDVCDFL